MEDLPSPSSPSPSNWRQITTVLIYSLLAIMGLIGNIWMLAVLTKLLGSPCRGGIRRHRNGAVSGVQFSACIYLLLLSVVDLISIVPVPLLAADILRNGWPFGTTLCKLLFTCEGANKSLSPLILTALSIDRYISVCQPSLFWMRQTRFALAVSTACIAASSLFIVPVTWSAGVSSLSDLRGIVHIKCVTTLSSRAYDVLHTLTCYVLPLGLICAVYVAILNRLYQHTRSVGRRTSISLSRVVKCSACVVAFYFVCWTPYWALRIHSLITTGDDSDVWALPVAEDVEGFGDLLPSGGGGGSGQSAMRNGALAAASAADNSPALMLKALMENISSSITSSSDFSAEQLTQISQHLLRRRDHFRNIIDSSSASSTSAEEMDGLNALHAKLTAIADASGQSTAAPTPNPSPSPNHQSFIVEFLLYLVHALPYTQSAFNWLFYAFLNRNLRASARQPALSFTARSVITITPAELNGNGNANGNGNGHDYPPSTPINGHPANGRPMRCSYDSDGGGGGCVLTNGHDSTTTTPVGSPLWKSVQLHMAHYLRAVTGLDFRSSSQSLLKRSPNRAPSLLKPEAARWSRSANHLDVSPPGRNGGGGDGGSANGEQAETHSTPSLLNWSSPKEEVGNGKANPDPSSSAQNIVLTQSSCGSAGDLTFGGVYSPKTSAQQQQQGSGRTPPESEHDDTVTIIIRRNSLRDTKQPSFMNIDGGESDGLLVDSEAASVLFIGGTLPDQCL